MIFKHSFCDPFKEDIIVLEDLPAEKIAAAFDRVPWATYLQKMEAADAGSDGRLRPCRKTAE